MQIASWRQSRALGVFAPAPHDPAAAAEMRRVGYGASVSYFVETGAFASMSIFAGWIGATAVATWAIVINFAAVVFMIPLGLATATAVLVGRAWGAGDLPGVRYAGVLGFRTALVTTLIVCAVVGIGAATIADFYTFDTEVRAATTLALLLSCLFFVADGLQVVGAQALRARGDVWTPSLTHSISYIAVMVPLAYLLAVHFGHGVPGIIGAVIVASLCAAVLLIGRFFMLARGQQYAG